MLVNGSSSVCFFTSHTQSEVLPSRLRFFFVGLLTGYRGYKPGLLDWKRVPKEFSTSLNNLSVDETTDSELTVDEANKKMVQYAQTDGRSIQVELI